MQSVREGRNPYVDGVTAQRAFWDYISGHPDAHVDPPLPYVYSPATLPLLRALNTLPPPVFNILFWALYILCAIAGALACLYAATPSEYPIFALLAPATLFLAGLLFTPTELSGNLAYIAYGSAFVTAVYGWKRSIWLPFYIAVFIASIYKTPLLTLLAIPIFTTRKQWTPATVTAALSLAVFFLQARIWPNLFRTYLIAVDLRFRLDQDFGFSPAGMLGTTLFRHHIDYSRPTLLLYGTCALLICFIFFTLSERYFAGRLTLQQWLPVLLTGTLLLDPRIKEYDVAAITIPMALILWRFARTYANRRVSTLAIAIFLALANYRASHSPDKWHTTEGCLLILIFLLGTWHLFRESASNNSATITSAPSGASA
jgi:hypothetical protein